MRDESSSKIAQLVADARTELKRLGIDTEGKRSDELLNMVREQRNRRVRQGRADHDAGGHLLAAVKTHEETSR